MRINVDKGFLACLGALIVCIGSQFRCGLSFEQYRQGTMDLEDVDAHMSLRGDLIEHLWARKGMNNMN
jgi:hypothetical protein